jgi:hypothetical protein
LSFASTAGGQRTCNSAAFAFFKKFAAHFLNATFGVTKPKEAPYAGTGGEIQSTFTPGFYKNLSINIQIIQLYAVAN